MNRRQFLKIGAAGAAAAAAGSVASKSFALNLNQSPTEFKIGIFAGTDAEVAKKSFEPFRTYLQNKLGIAVTLQTGTSYSAVIEALRNKFVDAMEVGPFAYVLASSVAKIEPMGVAITPKVPKGSVAIYSPKESPFYYSVIFTKKGNDIEKLTDLKGKRFSFVDPASTSGNLMPRSLLLKNGIDPDKDMQSIFAGSHPSSAVAVWNDKVDAGATYEQNLFDMTSGGLVDACIFADSINRRRTQAEISARFNSCKSGQLAILAYSDPIPNTPFGASMALPQQFRDALKKAVLEVKNDSALVASYKQWYVDPVAEFPTLRLKNIDQFYNGLRDVARLLKLDLSKMK